MSDEQPAEKPTVEIAQVPQWAVNLTIMVKDGLREMGADIKLVSNDLGIVKDRINIIESWKNDQDSRSARTSQRVQQASQSDLEQVAQLAQERAAREELAGKVDALTTTQATQLAILARLDAVAKNPLAKTLAAMLATAAITWLAAHGVHQ